MQKNLCYFSRIIYLLFAITFLLSNFKLTADSLAEEIKLLTSTTLTDTCKPVTRAKKDWTLLVYMAANNNLHEFALKNISQMLKVGSTNTINLLVQLDELGKTEVFRYYIEKDNAKILDVQAHNVNFTSGYPDSLYNFIKWGVKNFPANHIAVALWNHGSGIKDPSKWSKFLLKHRDDLYAFNSESNLYELNREIAKNRDVLNLRGIAFNDSFRTYLTNQDVKDVLERVVYTDMHGQKIDGLFCDACYMGMFEYASQIKNAVNFMTGSMEVEPGRGYNYGYVLAPFENGTLSPEEFAKHIVTAYEYEYDGLYADYTQSAFNLDYVSVIENLMSELSLLLCDLLKNEPTVFGKLLNNIRNSELSLEFYDRDYIDMCFFLQNLNEQLSDQDFVLKINSDFIPAVEQIKQVSIQCLNKMQNFIVKSVAGSSFQNAFGVSFYFPKRTMHESYFKTVFDKNTKWSQFLNKYISTKSKTTNMSLAKPKSRK
jgi:hypothetical protein